MSDEKNQRAKVEHAPETEERPEEIASAQAPAMRQTTKAGDPAESMEEEHDEAKRFSKIYSNIASNRYENLRTSYIENKAKELSKKRK